MSDFEYNNNLNKLMNSNLTRKDVVIRVNAILEGEYALPEKERDKELIAACNDLLYLVSRREIYVSKKEECRERLLLRLSAQRRKVENKRRFWRVCVSTICCIVLLIVLPIIYELTIKQEWIEGESNNGGEIYVLNGEEVSPQAIDSAIADGVYRDISISTSDYAKVSQIHKVNEMHINYIPNGWECYEYNYYCIGDLTYYIERFRQVDNSDEGITYQCAIYPDAEAVSAQIEQNEEGGIQLVNNQKVYFTHNMNMNVASWNRDLVSYSLFGDVVQDVLVLMIESIGGLKNGE